ncbi:MAG: N-acetyltransferase family protein [Bacteroidota bacterium]
MVRPVNVHDIEKILTIYSYYVKNSHATFELVVPTLKDFTAKISTADYKWLVYEEDSEVLGYAYATRWKMRAAYDKTVETSIYLDNTHHGKGIGKKLYQSLIEELTALKMHAIIGGISLPNEPSIALHEKLGFEKIGAFKEVGYKFDRWIDVGYWQLIL